jgi:hypothetical protein
MLSKEESDYFDDMEELFSTKGWKTLVEECKTRIYHLQADALEAHNFEKVCELRGEAKQLAMLISLEEVTAHQKSERERSDSDGEG